MRRPLTPFLRNSIMDLGQALTHAPQAVHLSSSTSGSPEMGFMLRAPNEQTVTQSPCPRHPNVQEVSPAYRAASTAQDEAPLKILVRGRLSQFPAQRITATSGPLSATAFPR